MRVEFGGLSVEALDDWEDVTSDMATGGAYTLARPKEGVGALQFSPALYRGGVIPNPSVADLARMLQDFSQQKNLGPPQGLRTSDQSGIRVATADFHAARDFIRVWYLTDGANLALATYLCDWKNRKLELAAAEEIVGSVRFGRLAS